MCVYKGAAWICQQTHFAMKTICTMMTGGAAASNGEEWSMCPNPEMTAQQNKRLIYA